MGDLKLFRIQDGSVTQIDGKSAVLEKSIQNLIEKHLPALLGVRFLASEYSTGPKHGGRIDSLGIDENGCPVIIEYKRTLNENVINQGLYYLDWLLDHKAEFQLRVMERLGQDEAAAIDWSSPRLLCIAGDFTKFDVHAVQQINRNIELIRYAIYGNDLLLLDLVNATSTSPSSPGDSGQNQADKPGSATNAQQTLERADAFTVDLFEALKSFLVALGDDVQVKPLKLYFAFRRLKNFACVLIQHRQLKIWVKVDPGSVALEEGFTKDVSKIGHWGTGDLEILISSMADLEKAKPLLVRSYEGN